MKTILLLLLTCNLQYHSPLLEKVALAMGAGEAVERLADGTNYRALSYSGFPVTVRKQAGVVQHIGFSLFGPEAMNTYSRPVAEFIERYPLELMLGIDKERSKEIKMFEDGVEFLEGSMKEMLVLLCTDTVNVSTGLDNIRGRRYCFRWSGPGGQGKLVFPVDWQLISGRTMLENEDALQDDILAAGALSPLPVPEMSDESGNDGLVIMGIGFYYLESLSSNRYYTASDKGRLTLFSNPEQVKEYTANLFTGAGIPNDFSLSVKLRKYGFKSTYFSVKLDQWLSFCLESGCTPYWGIVSIEQGFLTGELIMHNEACGYDHLMKVIVPLDTLKSGSGEFRCRLVPYIPLHSLRYLFEETKS